MTACSRIAKDVIAGVLVLALAAIANAQQAKPVQNGSAQTAQQANEGPQRDPNMPPQNVPPDSQPISWTYHTPTRPTVHFMNPAADGDYMGFNDQGSVIQNQGNGKVYVWNGKDNTLTVLANNVNEVPTAVLQSLKNTDEEIGYLLAKRGIVPKPEPVVAGGAANAQQAKPAQNGSAQTAQQVNQGPQRDPNFPPQIVPPDSQPIYWTVFTTTPEVHFRNPAADGVYLGFNENGSLIRNPANGKIYYWKLKDPKTVATGTLTEAYNNYLAIPPEVLESLQNPNHTVTERLAMLGRAPKGRQPEPVVAGGSAANAQQAKPAQNSSAQTAQQANQGPQRDPNMPPQPVPPDSQPISWELYTNPPMVHFRKNGADGLYLGYNDQGSLIHNQGDGKIYLWNLKANTLTVFAKSFNDIPVDTLASLQNPNHIVTEKLALNGRGPKGPNPGPVVAGGSTPSPKPPQANPFGPNAGSALAGLAPSGASTSDIAGTDARVTNGILTFTLRSGAKSKPYNVARPRVMANNPQAAGTGITGAWIAMEDGGNGVLFTVQGDNSVTGKEIPPPLVQMLMQRAPKPQ